MTLTPELRQAVQDANGEPVRLEDPETHDAYYLLKAEVYERVRERHPTGLGGPGGNPAIEGGVPSRPSLPSRGGARPKVGRLPRGRAGRDRGFAAATHSGMPQPGAQRGGDLRRHDRPARTGTRAHRSLLLRVQRYPAPMKILRRLPYFEERTEVALPDGTVPVLPYQIVVTISITVRNLMELPPDAPRFPAVLDTGTDPQPRDPGGAA